MELTRFIPNPHLQRNTLKKSIIKEVNPLKIYVTMKSLAKRKAYLEKVELHLEKNPQTITELISELVSINVSTYNQRIQDAPMVHFLTKQDIEEKGTVGKVGFDISYNEQKADVEESIQTAIQAFEDGLFKVFVNDIEQGVEEPAISLNDGDQIAFIKLTMLAGRMW
jgi:hypothetical protein